jgi:hypothetical protein
MGTAKMEPSWYEALRMPSVDGSIMYWGGVLVFWSPPPKYFRNVCRNDAHAAEEEPDVHGPQVGLLVPWCLVLLGQVGDDGVRDALFAVGLVARGILEDGHCVSVGY